MKWIKRLLYRFGVVERLSRRRLRLIDRVVNHRLLTPGDRPIRLLDVGCATGKDFVRFFKDRPDVHITGIDLHDYGLKQDNFEMVVADAADIPYPDDHFDLTVSIGVFEHIIPIEKLAAAVREIDRVSKSYVMIVPSVSTLIEPHIAKPLWQLRDRSKKTDYGSPLIYLNDEAWMAFEGFKEAKSIHYKHVPLFVSNLVIYKVQDDWKSDQVPSGKARISSHGSGPNDRRASMLHRRHVTLE